MDNKEFGKKLELRSLLLLLFDFLFLYPKRMREGFLKIKLQNRVQV